MPNPAGSGEIWIFSSAAAATAAPPPWTFAVAKRSPDPVGGTLTTRIKSRFRVWRGIGPDVVQTTVAAPATEGQLQAEPPLLTPRLRAELPVRPPSKLIVTVTTPELSVSPTFVTSNQSSALPPGGKLVSL